MEMVKFTTKNNKIIIITCVVIILCSVLSIRLLCQNKENQNKEKSEALLSASNGELCFYERTNDPNVFAIGTIVKNESSVVFLWNKTANTTEIETDYKPATEEEIQVFKNIIEKKAVSNWTGNRIVPCDITKKSENIYHFKYYDGYEFHWSWGYAHFYLNNQTIEWMGHVKG
jgi:hypothetical protein